MYDFVWKKYDFLIAKKQKVGATGHCALQEQCSSCYDDWYYLFIDQVMLKYI